MSIKMLKTLSSAKIKLVFILFFLTTTFSVFAQRPNLEFTSLNALKDISNINATAVVQDSAGYLWIGTDQGLFKFDGQTVYTYRYNENDKKSLPFSRINKLFIDKKQNLWVCTSEGLYKYNPESDNFTPVVVDGNLKGVPGYDIGIIAQDNSGQIYIAYEKTIYKYNQQQNNFSKILELKKGYIHAIIFDYQDNIWIGSYFGGGLSYYDQGKKQITSFIHDPANKQSISNNEVYDVALVKNKLWIATFGGGIDSYDFIDKSFKHYISPATFENFAIQIFADHKQNIWICTLGCLKFYDPATDNFYNYYPNANDPKALAKNVLGFYQDHQGNFWSYHSIFGIHVAMNNNNFKQYDTKPENFWHTTENNISALAFDGSGNLWIGNYYNGIDVFNFKEQKTERFRNEENNPSSLGNGTIFAIFRDSKNRMWVGSNMGGLQQFIPETKSFVSYKNNPDDSLSIANNDVRSIAEDSNGDLWVALEGKGVDRFDLRDKTFHHYNKKNKNLSTNYLFQVFADSKGNIWVGTSWGLNVLRKGENKFNYFIFNKNDSTSISSNAIRAIHEDAQHNIWIGTLEGLNKYNPENQTFTRYSHGLTNKQVSGMIGDNKNNIWLSTKDGISRFDPLTRRFSNYNQEDGLLSSSFNTMSCCKSINNDLYFGGIDGIDFFNPDSLKAEPKPPPVVLTDFMLFNKSITFKNDSSILQKHISYAKNIRLSYNNNSFSFRFQAINLIHSDKITYAYKLDGFDKDWIYSGGKNEAVYSNMEPGKYRFRVKARYDNRDWSMKETTVSLDIIPAWWMTIGFKILLALMIISVVSGIFYLRTKRLLKQSEKLEQLVAERTNEISAKNDQLKSQAISLEQKNDQLKNLNSTKDKLFSIISHDLRSPFSAILGFQDLLEEQYFELSDEERLEMIGQLNATSRQTYSLIENLLNWAQIQTSNIHYYPEQFDVVKVIKEKLDLYQSIANSKNINIELQLAETQPAFADIDLFHTTLRNLITNAIKFSNPGGNIRLGTSQTGKFITISIIDNGIGMKKKQLDSLFDLEHTKIQNGTNGERGSGLGLILCKEFVEKNKGSISVVSEPGKGSTFSFTLPATQAR